MQRRGLFLAAGLAVLGLAACSQGESATTSAQEQARKTAAILKGDDKGSAEQNPICRMFKARELEIYVGEPLDRPQNAGMGAGCQWFTRSDSGDVLISVVAKRYYEPREGAADYREIAGIGERAWSAHELDGWAAGAVVGERAIYVSVAGRGASVQTAEALLREAVRRLPPG